jgi:hypothetical protein
MSRQPYNWYVDQYNMTGKSRKKAAYRFSKESWESLEQYRKWENEDAVKSALEAPGIELMKNLSKDGRNLECLHCRYGNWWGGAAMTNYSCAICKRVEMWGSTATPKLCDYCAFRGFKCRMCGESREKDLPTPPTEGGERAE